MRPTSSRGELITRISRRCRQPSIMASRIEIRRRVPKQVSQEVRPYWLAGADNPSRRSLPVCRIRQCAAEFPLACGSPWVKQNTGTPMSAYWPPPHARRMLTRELATRTGTCPASWLGPGHATDVSLSRSWASSGKLMKSALFASAASTRASASPKPISK